MKKLMLYVMIGSVLVSSSAAETQNERPQEQSWDLQKEVLSMDCAAWWTGPARESNIGTSVDVGSGRTCIVADIHIEPQHHVRIEKNFVCDCHEGFRNMMAFGMVDEDFTPYRTITFDFKTDIGNIKALIFRLYDRQGGWVQWEVPAPSLARKWREVALEIPPRAWPKVNLRRTGGFVWEFRAGDESVDGKVYLDNMQLQTECKEDAVPGSAHGLPRIDHERTINPPPVKDKHATGAIELIMNMSGEIGHAMAAHETDLAIQYLSDAVAVFKDVPGLAYFFQAEAWRFKRNPTPEELASGERPEPKQWLEKSHQTYVAVSKWCEENQVPFYVGICMSGDSMPAVEPKTLQACLEAAPKYCRGALMGEYSIESNGGIDWVVEYMKLLKPRGLKLIYFQQSSYWFGILMPHGNEFRARVLAPEFRDVFVPAWENLLPSAQGLCLATMLGMWQGGLVNDWGVSAQSWGYANMNWGGTSDQPGSMWLRMFLTVASFGGRYLEIEPKWAFDGENVPGQITHFKQWAHNLRWVGRRRAQIDIDRDPSGPMRALRLFNRMIRAGAVLPAAGPEKVVSISPNGFQAQPTDDWIDWGLFHRGIDKNFFDGCCPNYTDMSAQTPRSDVFSYLYQSNHFYDQTFPVTDYGLVSFLPAQSEPGNAQEIFKADGNKVMIDEKWVPARRARKRILESFERAAKVLPFAVQDCTWSAIEVGKGEYLVTLVDPEERFPVGVETRLHVHVGGDWKAVDAMDGSKLEKEGDFMEVIIDPASFRLIRIIVQDIPAEEP